MRFEHNGDSYRIDFEHLQFKTPVTLETRFRGERLITALTECFIIRNVKGDKKNGEETVAAGTSKCAVGDRFCKATAREKSVRRAADGITDRELRGKVLMAYFTRPRG